MDCRRRSHDFDEAIPIFDFHGPAGILISAYKFGGRTGLASWFADRIAALISERWPGRVLVPVPPRRSLSGARSADHIERIARILSASGLTVARPLLRGPSQEQKKLGLRERAANASRAYRLRPFAKVPESVVIFDDVFTSGATADACSRALRQGGATAVAFVSIAVD